MSMYLPNPDLQPTGFEPGEYIDPSTIVPEPTDPTDHENAPSPPTSTKEPP